MKRFYALYLVLLAACSSSTSGGGGTRAVGGSAVKCTVGHNFAETDGVPATCLSCAMSACGDVFDKAFGPDPNSFGGACESYLACYCDTTAADNMCDLNQSSSCKQASDAISTCVESSCANPCSGYY
jgi:hypothetical protein